MLEFLEKFYLQSQGHPGVKVTSEYVSGKVLSKGMLCPSMK